MWKWANGAVNKQSSIGSPRVKTLSHNWVKANSWVGSGLCRWRPTAGTEPVLLSVTPLRDNQGHETDHFAATRSRVR